MFLRCLPHLVGLVPIHERFIVVGNLLHLATRFSGRGSSVLAGNLHPGHGGT